MSRTFLYFGYGSNLLAKRLHINNPSAVRAGAGKLKNYRLDFYKYSRRWQGYAATIVPDTRHHVWGALWEINLEHLEALDKQEGVSEYVYFRFEVEVETLEGMTKKCLVYQLVENPTEYFKLAELPEDRRPSQAYLNTIITGAEESHLPQEYQQFLRTIAHNGFNGEVDLKLEM